MRRHLDAYYTPEKFVAALAKRVDISGVIYEPCVGAGHILEFFRKRNYTVISNDIDKTCMADTHFDARNECAWERSCDWVISNPPFNCAYDILLQACKHARVGVAMLLRLSFLEPCKRNGDRETFLVQNPPSHVFVTPRVSFTGDGRKDTVTSMWAVWQRGCLQTIEIIPKSEIL